MRNLILSAALVTASLFGMTAQAADVPLEAGKTYVELANPVPVSVSGQDRSGGAVLVRLPALLRLRANHQPMVEKLPKDVNFKRIPAMFGGPWDAHGQLFLTLEAMGVEHKVHNAVFEAIQKQGKRLTKPEDMADFVATQGVDKDKFLATFNSFAIKGQIEAAKKLAVAYGVQGVPTMIVNGKYRFDLGTTGGPEATLNVADQLIAKERAAK